MKKEVNTVIIGAGICGLSAAHFLSKKRSDFLILEASNLPGGIIKTKIENDFICENGPNTVPVSYTHLRAHETKAKSRMPSSA